MEAPKLEILRAEASEQSLGMSHPVIHDTVWKTLAKKNLKYATALDVGAGRGEFVSFLSKKTDWKLYGVDLMYSKIPNVEWFVQDLNRNLQFQDEKFDLVSCIEVVEHVENPRKLVREMYRILRPGGLMVLSTPNNQSWRAILSYIFREHFVAFTASSYPAHITAVNRADLSRMCNEAGFIDVQFEYTNSGALPKWTHVSWQSVSANRLRGMRFSDNIVCCAQKPFATLKVAP